jgi:hypothetical protein
MERVLRELAEQPELATVALAIAAPFGLLAWSRLHGYRFELETALVLFGSALVGVVFEGWRHWYRIGPLDAQAGIALGLLVPLGLIAAAAIRRALARWLDSEDAPDTVTQEPAKANL